jgi:agmatine/peptidylarginine deiminase
MKKLNFSDLKKGMKVQDDDGHVGTIVKFVDMHNILVKYEIGNSGYGFYCLDPENKKYYDPLYKYKEK